MNAIEPKVFIYSRGDPLIIDLWLVQQSTNIDYNNIMHAHCL